MIELTLPLNEKEIRKLRVGDNVSLSGIMVTGRDAAHSWLTSELRTDMKEVLSGTAVYHCGPVVAETDEGYSFVAAGPTTSIREEPYQAEVIKNYNVRAVIGKGGMGDKTLQAMNEHGAVYLHAIGGAASLIAENVVKVHDVFMLEEFGVPEAMWVIEVKNFSAVVTMDSHGNSLHRRVREKSAKIAEQLISSQQNTA